ncbi:stalk domain-containing protein [Paenibacillus sp. CMAA1364]
MMFLKKGFTLVITAMMLITFSMSVNAGSSIPNVNIKSSVLGEKSFTGQIINGRTYVDFIGLLNCLPFLVNSKAISFDSKSKTLHIFDSDFATNTTPILQFHVGDNYFMAGNEKIDLDTKIILSNNRIYIPLVPVATVYHLKVTFDKKINLVHVSK